MSSNTQTATRLEGGDALERAQQAVHYAVTPHGIVASVTGADNYRRVWARDAVIAGLAGLIADDQVVIDGLRRSLELLAKTPGADGQIPSNIEVNDEGEVRSVSLGSIAGRVDPLPWFVIGTCLYAKHTGDIDFARKMQRQMRSALDLLATWEFNRRGLVYVPQGGDWADEYILSGYVFFPQILRLWAEEVYADLFQDDITTRHAEDLRRLLEVNYWPTAKNLHDTDVYHQAAFERFVEGNPRPEYFQAALAPGGYAARFDAFGNAIALLIGLGSSEQQDTILEYFEGILGTIKTGLPPAFWPPIFENDREWPMLSGYYLYEFSNYPYQYSNGGSWPMLAGWWILALECCGKKKLAAKVYESLCAFLALSADEESKKWGFHEYGHSKTGEPMGVPHTTWSASAVLMGDAALRGSRL